MKQKSQRFAGQFIREVVYDYLLYLPPSYHEDPNKNWPLVLFLHGAGERGQDLTMLPRQGLPKLIEDGQDFPFILVSPQCHENSFWPYEVEPLTIFLQNVIEEYQVDIERIYLTGLSMGGFGSWHLGEAHPRVFAAIAPICGGAAPMIGFPERIRVLKDVPIWAFHGSKDEVVPIQMSQALVEELRECGSDVRFTTYEGVGHDAWTETYNNPELYTWMLAQRNKDFSWEG